MERGGERPGPRRPPGCSAPHSLSRRDQRQPARGLVPFHRGGGGQVAVAADGAVSQRSRRPGAGLRGSEDQRLGGVAARSAPVGCVLAGSELVGSPGPGPLLGRATAAEPAGHAVVGHPEDTGLLPADRPGQRVAPSPALVRAPRASRSPWQRPGDRRRHALSLPRQAAGAQAGLLLVPARPLGDVVRRALRRASLRPDLDVLRERSAVR